MYETLMARTAEEALKAGLAAAESRLPDPAI
jgi:hypothetical protein